MWRIFSPISNNWMNELPKCSQRLSLLSSGSVFQWGSWPGIAAPSPPAEFWQRMTQNRLTSWPGGGWRKEGRGGGGGGEDGGKGAEHQAAEWGKMWRDEQRKLCVSKNQRHVSFVFMDPPRTRIHLHLQTCVWLLSASPSRSALKGAQDVSQMINHTSHVWDNSSNTSNIWGLISMGEFKLGRLA